MTLRTEDWFNEQMGVANIHDVQPAQFPSVISCIPEMSDELRVKVLDQVPGFRQYAIEAMKAVEETLETTTGAIGKEQTELHESFMSLRQILAGRLKRDGISEEHERYIIDRLVELQAMEKEQKTETNKLIGEQGDATRLAKLADAAIPIITTVLATGVQILINRRGGGGYRI